MDNRRPVVLFPPAGMVVPANPALDAAYLLAVRTCARLSAVMRHEYIYAYSPLTALVLTRNRPLDCTCSFGSVVSAVPHPPRSGGSPKSCLLLP